MSTLRKYVLLLAMAASPLLGCSDGNTAGPELTPVSPLAGTWRATSWELSDVADPTVRLDLANYNPDLEWYTNWGLGVGPGLYLSDRNSFVIGFGGPPTATEIGDFATGTWASAGSTLTLTVTDATGVFPEAFAPGATVRLTISSDQKTLVSEELHTAWDFDACGHGEMAHLNITMVQTKPFERR